MEMQEAMHDVFRFYPEVSSRVNVDDINLRPRGRSKEVVERTAQLAKSPKEEAPKTKTKENTQSTYPTVSGGNIYLSSVVGKGSGCQEASNAQVSIKTRVLGENGQTGKKAEEESG